MHLTDTQPQANPTPPDGHHSPMDLRRRTFRKETGERRREKGYGIKDMGERRREKGDGRKETGERRREKGDWR